MDDAVGARALKKAMWRIVPYLMLLYFVSFLNRVNVGFAALTMNSDVGLSKEAYGFGAGIFAFGYFLFEVPSNLILAKLGARRWIARILVTWGLVSAGMALTQGPNSFYALRFLLGVAEAGFFPGIILYLTYWFPTRKRAAVTAAFMAAAPISTAVGSPLSGAIMSMIGSGSVLGMKDWQWLFVIEGLPAVILGFVTLKVMTDRPSLAKWLTPEEAASMEAPLRAEEAARAGSAKHSVLSSLADPRILTLALIYFGTSAGLYTIGLWAPQILADYHLPKLQIGWLNAIPSVVAVIGSIWWARHSDRSGERTWHVVLACLLAAAGLAWAANLTGLVACIAALAVVNLGITAAKPPLWSMPTLFLGGAGAAAGIALINSIGNLGGFFGPYIVGAFKQRTGSYDGGLYAVAASLVVSAVLALILSHRTAKPSPVVHEATKA